jgi:flagellar biogenesis protein FliO
MYVLMQGFRKTPMFRQMATNPVKIKSVTPTGGKTKLLLVEAYGSHILLAASDQKLSFIKEFEPYRLRQYEFEQAQAEASGHQDAFEAALGKAVGRNDEKSHEK